MTWRLEAQVSYLGATLRTWRSVLGPHRRYTIAVGEDYEEYRYQNMQEAVGRLTRVGNQEEPLRPTSSPSVAPLRYRIARVIAE